MLLMTNHIGMYNQAINGNNNKNVHNNNTEKGEWIYK